MILKKLKKKAKLYQLSKQEGNFSALNTASPVNYGIFSEAWFEVCPLNFDFICWAYAENQGMALFRQDKYYEVTSYEFKKYLKGRGSQPAAIVRFMKYVAICDKNYEKNDPNFLKKSSQEDLRRIILSSIELTGILQRDSLFCEALDEKISLDFYLSLSGKTENFTDFFTGSSLLAFDSFKVRREKEILKLLKTTRKIDPYKVKWMNTDYFSGQTIEETVKFVSKFDPKKMRREIANQTKLIKKNKASRTKFLENIDPRFRKLADFIYYGMYIRDFRKDYFAKAQTIVYDAAYELFLRLGINPKDCAYSYYTDYSTKIVSKPSFKRLIKQRRKGFLVMAEGIPMKHYLDVGNYPQMKQKLMLLHDSSQKDIKSKIVKGSVACRGNVRGVVKIILHSKDFHDFKMGDILVTSMTRPEFLPVIKKAAAIITDEGGITCHASIISRELNIPCLIGTQNATRILKDGDLVEVDANKGLVQILKNRKDL